MGKDIKKLPLQTICKGSFLLATNIISLDFCKNKQIISLDFYKKRQFISLDNFIFISLHPDI